MHLYWKKPAILGTSDFKLLHYKVKVKEGGIFIISQPKIVFEKEVQDPKLEINNTLSREKPYTIEISTVFQDFDKDEQEESDIKQLKFTTSKVEYTLYKVIYYNLIHS